MVVYNAFVLLVFLIAYTKTQATDTMTVKPSVTCWYTRYTDGVRSRSAVFGYNSTFTTNVSIRYADNLTESRNELVIDGVRFSGVLPDYYPGFNVTAFALRAYSFSFVNWTLDSQRIVDNVTIGSKENVALDIDTLTNETMCYTVFNGTCPGVDNLSVVDYCDDGIFCNGPEICDLGRCVTDTTRVPVCPLGCNETIVSCNLPPPSPPDNCIANASCVVPILTCLYVTYEDGRQQMNLILGYNNTGTQDIAFNTIATMFDTNGTVSIVPDFTRYVVEGSSYAYVVEDATYLNWTIGANSYVWTSDMTRDDSFTCMTKFGGVCNASFPGFCGGFSFCYDYTCEEQQQCVLTLTCDEGLVCNDETYTCDDPSVSQPGSNTGSSNLENTPNSIPIVVIPAFLVVGALITTFLRNNGIFRPSLRR